MSASGKSSNRYYEEELGYSGHGHGIYAAEGSARFVSEQCVLHEARQAHDTSRCSLCTNAGRGLLATKGDETSRRESQARHEARLPHDKRCCPLCD